MKGGQKSRPPLSQVIPIPALLCGVSENIHVGSRSLRLYFEPQRLGSCKTGLLSPGRQDQLDCDTYSLVQFERNSRSRNKVKKKTQWQNLGMVETYSEAHVQSRCTENRRALIFLPFSICNLGIDDKAASLQNTAPLLGLASPLSAKQVGLISDLFSDGS